MPFFSSVFSDEKTDKDKQTVHFLLSQCRESLDVMYYSQCFSSVVIKPVYRKWPINERHEVETTFTFTLKRNRELLKIDGKNISVYNGETNTHIFNHTINRDISVRFGASGDYAVQGGTVSKNLKEERIFCSQGISYAFWLDGYIGFTGDCNLAEYLLKEGSAIVMGNEIIDNHQCILISAQTPHGDFKLWIDPSAGCLFRKIENHKKQKDKGKPRSDDAFSDVVIVLDEIVVELIQGKPIITQGRLYWEGLDPLGRVGGEQYVAKRNQVDLNPVFDTNSFIIDIPEGIDIINLDDKDSGVTYIWDGQKPVAGYTFLEGEALMYNKGYWVRIAMMALGAMMILLAVIMKLRKYKQK